MVLNLLIYYNLYLLFTPYILFWLNYIYFLISIFFNKLRKKYKIYYFPEETESMFWNFFIILPQRLAFKLVYSGFNKTFYDFIKTIIICFSIIILIGVPFIQLKIIYLYWKHNNIWKAWYNLSNYQNLKIIVIKGTIFRNMKKTISYCAKQSMEVYEQASNKTIMGLYKIENKPLHLVSYSIESQIGVLFTSKTQLVQLIPNEFLILNELGSKAYVQKFNNINLYIEKDDITNIQLEKLAKNYGVDSNIKANYIISKTNLNNIIMNYQNKQILTKIEKIDIYKSQQFIKDCGGVDKIINHISFRDFYIQNLVQSKLLINKLKSATKDERLKIFNEKKEIYENLVSLNKTDSNNEIENILINIENLLK